MSALTDLFTSIANAIRTKTGSTASITASNFPTEIGNIENASDYIDDTISYNGSTAGLSLIKKLPKLASLPSGQTNLAGCFTRTEITTIDLSNWITNSVTTMNSMFQGCSSLQSITLSSTFYCNKIINIANIFANCTNLTTITGRRLQISWARLHKFNCKLFKLSFRLKYNKS